LERLSSGAASQLLVVIFFSSPASATFVPREATSSFNTVRQTFTRASANGSASKRKQPFSFPNPDKGFAVQAARPPQKSGSNKSMGVTTRTRVPIRRTGRRAYITTGAERSTTAHQDQATNRGVVQITSQNHITKKR